MAALAMLLLFVRRLVLVLVVIALATILAVAPLAVVAVRMDGHSANVGAAVPATLLVLLMQTHQLEWRWLDGSDAAADAAAAVAEPSLAAAVAGPTIADVAGAVVAAAATAAGWHDENFGQGRHAGADVVLLGGVFVGSVWYANRWIFY